MSDLSSPRAEGRVAAVGSGTGLVGAISFIPDEATKQICLLAVPTVTIFVGWIWSFARSRIIRWVNAYELDKAIARAEANRDRIHSDPNSTQEEKDNSTQAVADLRKIRTEAVKDDYLRLRADLIK